MIVNGAPAAADEEERRRRRAEWPVRRFRLGEEPSEDLSSSTTMEERITMMWRLAVDASAYTDGVPGRTPRDTWPVKVRRLGDPEVD